HGETVLRHGGLDGQGLEQASRRTGEDRDSVGGSRQLLGEEPLDSLDVLLEAFPRRRPGRKGPEASGKLLADERLPVVPTPRVRAGGEVEADDRGLRGL